MARLKAAAKKAAAKAAAPENHSLVLAPWHKRCPKCQAQVHVRKPNCQCGHRF
jgi:hypothetical protein